MRWWHGVLIVTLGLCFIALANESPRLPDLPSLCLRDFLPEVRDQVQQAYGAARGRPHDAAASGRLGMLLDLYNRPEEASVCYERAHQLDARSFQWLYYLGSLLAKQGKHSEAARTLRAALRLNPDYLAARLKLAESLFNARELETSHGVYTEIVQESPDAAEAYFGLGRIAVARGDPTAARESFRKACDLFPAYGAAHYALAQVDRKLGKSEEAQQELALHAQNKTVVPPVDDPLRDEMRKLDKGAAAHLERGVQLEQVGRLEDAIKETEEALRLDPGLVKAHINLLILYGRAGNLEKAEEHYQAAVQLNPTQFPDAYYDYGVLMMKEGKLEQAEKSFRAALEIDPSYADAHNNLGLLLEGQGKLQEAIVEYRRAIAGKPDFRRARFNLGRVSVNLKDYQGGIEQLQQTLTPVDEDTPTYLFALGAAYGRAGDSAKALQYLEQAKEQAMARGQASLVSEIEKALETVKAGKASRSPGIP